MRPGKVGGIAFLVAALPLGGQTQPRNAKIQELLRFTLNETAAQVRERMGPPTRIDDSVAGYLSWQYDHPADERNDDNSPPAWFICIRAAGGQILSVTRNFDTPQDVDDLFPQAETAAHHWPSSDAPQFSVRLRRLQSETLLLAMGSGTRGERTTQLVLIRRSALKTFMPWLAEQME